MHGLSGRVRTRRTQDRDGEGHAASHRWAITVPSSGPRSRRPSRANCLDVTARHERVTTRTPAVGLEPGRGECRTDREARSRQRMNEATSRPITSAMVRARNG